jgi:hypothetical protein
LREVIRAAAASAAAAVVVGGRHGRWGRESGGFEEVKIAGTAGRSYQIPTLGIKKYYSYVQEMAGTHWRDDYDPTRSTHDDGGRYKSIPMIKS